MARNNVDASYHDMFRNLETSKRTPSAMPRGWEMALVEEICLSKDQVKNRGIGHIRFRRIYADDNKAYSMLLWAKPFTTTTQYPLKGEYVMVANGPSTISTNGSVSDEYKPPFYYIGPLNAGGDINKNTTENLVGDDVKYSNEDPATKLQEDANADQEGYGPETEGSKTYGKAFIPSTQIWPLQPLEGDYIIQGRTGNSIRLSHSQLNPEESGDLTKGYLESPWSDNPDEVDGDPILIIRNGQDDSMDEMDITDPASPASIWETLKGDGSSIWLTAGQTINSLREIFNDTGEDGTGVATTSRMKQEGLGQLLGVSSTGEASTSVWGQGTPMAVIASDRIVFLAKEDEILLFGKSGIGMAADGPVTIESDSAVVIEAPEIEFRGGVKFGDNAAVDGEKLVELLEELINEISTLKVSTAVGPGTALPSAGLQNLLPKLDELLVSS